MKCYQFTLFCFFSACTLFLTPQQKAERVARTYLDSAITDFGRFELVKSSPIDRLRSGPDHEPAYQMLTVKIDSARRVTDSLIAILKLEANAPKRKLIEQHIGQTTTTTNSLLQQSLQYMLNYEGQPRGWILEQTYRSKKCGDTLLYTHVFKFNEHLSKVVGHQSRKS